MPLGVFVTASHLRNCPGIISVIRRRMDFQSVRKKTDWKSILRFAKPVLTDRNVDFKSRSILAAKQ